MLCLVVLSTRPGQPHDDGNGDDAPRAGRGRRRCPRTTRRAWRPAGLSCARFAPATCAMVERDLGCASPAAPPRAAPRGRGRVQRHAPQRDAPQFDGPQRLVGAAADEDDDDDGAPAAWSLTGTYVLLRAPGRLRRAGCLAAVAVAVASSSARASSRYEYEFLFDAGAMGKFEGLVPKASTRSSPSSSRGRGPRRLRPPSSPAGVGIWLLVGLWPFLKNALVFGVCALVGRRGRAASLLKGLALLGKWSLVKVTAASCLFAMVNLDIKAGHAAQRPGLLRRAAARRHLALLVGVLASRIADLGPRRVPARRAFTRKRPRAAAYCCGRGPARRESRGDGRRRRRPRAALRPAEVGDDVPPRARSLPTIPMGGDEATWSALGLLAESSGAERGECGPRGGRRRRAPPRGNCCVDRPRVDGAETRRQ